MGEVLEPVAAVALDAHPGRGEVAAGSGGVAGLVPFVAERRDRIWALDLGLNKELPPRPDRTGRERLLDESPSGGAAPLVEA
jgi:hypothetical protein